MDDCSDSRWVPPSPHREILRDVLSRIARIEPIARLTGPIAAVASVLGCCGAVAAAEAVPPLRLAEEGRTPYRIIIGTGAEPGEVLGAEELSLFLVRMTGATFAVERDDTPATEHEIVLGRTNRFDLGNAAVDLRPTTLEGFCVERQNQRLIIAGATPRATLYGVYDVLEVELGCRFLAPGVDYVPRHPTLTADIVPRRYDPALEYRNLYADETWAVRNRLNATWSWVPMADTLGGVRFVGPSFVHTFGYLVPAETHFAAHPDYYALVDGHRHPTDGGGSGQLCLTHPDVLRLATETARGWIRSAGHDPHSRCVVSISPNDNGMVCECPACAAVNREERTPGGTLVRFVNAVAAAVAGEFPTVRVETLAYGPSLAPPSLTRPRDNVIIRFAPIGADFGRPLDDPASAMNRPTCESIMGWSGMGARIYVWHYVVNFHAYFRPFPNLRVLASDVRFLRQCGMTGLYAQGSQTPGSDLRAVRDYLLAKLMWRPDTDARRTMEEFCRLYYGAGAAGVLQYIELVHDCYERQGVPLAWNDASRRDAVVYDGEFIAAADAILAQAEAAAETPEQSLRVATVRLSVWYLMLVDLAATAPEAAREAGRRFLEVSRAVGVTHMSEFYGPAGAQLENEFYPRIEALLRQRPGDSAEPLPGVLRQLAAFLNNNHHTFRIVAETESMTGSCALQSADRAWTLGQAMTWAITEPLKASAEAEAAPHYRLRARVRVDAKGAEGGAFRFGYARQHADWSADICAEIQVRADQIQGPGWIWYELPEPVRYHEAANGQCAFVWPANNPANVTAVYLDAFELTPAK